MDITITQVAIWGSAVILLGTLGIGLFFMYLEHRWLRQHPDFEASD